MSDDRPTEPAPSTPDSTGISDELKLTTEHDKLDEWNDIRGDYTSEDEPPPDGPVFDDDPARPAPSDEATAESEGDSEGESSEESAPE